MIREPMASFLRPVEIAIAAAVLASLAPAAVPPQIANSIARNEATAIESLRTIAAAQARFKGGAHIDTNCDGVGEYGYFGELAGTVPMRISVGNPCIPGAGSPPDDNLFRPLLRSAFGAVRYSCVAHRGYIFQMWLPDRTNGNLPIPAVREDRSGGKLAAPFPDPVHGAQMWCCYAWPVEYDRTGRRAFFIDQRGDVLEYSNRSANPFSGFPALPTYENGPPFDEAYSVPGDMGSPPRIGVPNAHGSIWWVVP